MHKIRFVSQSRTNDLKILITARIFKWMKNWAFSNIEPDVKVDNYGDIPVTGNVYEDEQTRAKFFIIEQDRLDFKKIIFDDFFVHQKDSEQIGDAVANARIDLLNTIFDGSFKLPNLKSLPLASMRTYLEISITFSGLGSLRFICPHWAIDLESSPAVKKLPDRKLKRANLINGLVVPLTFELGIGEKSVGEIKNLAAGIVLKLETPLENKFKVVSNGHILSRVGLGKSGSKRAVILLKE